ncbi:PWWP domain-containing protein Pdp1 [Schizosaccharomyces octosporus yFS286]|uniref:PWWP domain-containing protein Pdp1 n=1 Tax=Schizosaccharomyces octosporus (strain yFS286) TaxID=483514 RepID=S9RA59_SCHOY|nr:PWWP domain-containing protein Pdp1 [Schizosaccharomyces octosporus yFS286]EPX75010.1 PWWP domain-containing protein Pdp1 [Schizosaccharomyces octosporus yFS286]
MDNGNNPAVDRKHTALKVEKKGKSETKAYTLHNDGIKSTSTNLMTPSIYENVEDGTQLFHRGDRVLAKVSGYPWYVKFRDRHFNINSCYRWPAQIIRYKLMNREGVTIEKSPEHFYKVQFFPNLEFSWVKQTGLKPLANEDIDYFLSSVKRKSKVLQEAYKAACEPPYIESEESTEEEGDLDENNRSERDTYLLNKRKRNEFEDLSTKTDADRFNPLSTISSISEMYGNLSSSKLNSTDLKWATNNSKTGYKNNCSRWDLNQRKRLSPLNTATSEIKTLVQRLLYFRFKLQKLFLSSNSNFEEENLYRAKEYLKEIEEFPYLNYEMIITTKIAKVLKRIALRDELQKEELLSIRGQCKDILFSWKHNLSNTA